MNQSKNHRKGLLVAGLLMSTLACTTQATNTAAVGSVEAAPATAVSTSPGKPSAPATVTFQAASTRLVPGAPLTVQAIITPTANVDAMEVRFSLSEGLTAVNALPVLSLGAQKAGTVHSQAVLLSALAGGPQFLNVFVTTQQGSQRMIKTVSHPLNAGSSAPQGASPVKAAPGGERVISLPASEPRR